MVYSEKRNSMCGEYFLRRLASNSSYCLQSEKIFRGNNNVEDSHIFLQQFQITGSTCPTASSYGIIVRLIASPEFLLGCELAVRNLREEKTTNFYSWSLVASF